MSTNASLQYSDTNNKLEISEASNLPSASHMPISTSLNSTTLPLLQQRIQHPPVASITNNIDGLIPGTSKRGWTPGSTATRIYLKRDPPPTMEIKGSSPSSPRRLLFRICKNDPIPSFNKALKFQEVQMPLTLPNPHTAGDLTAKKKEHLLQPDRKSLTMHKGCNGTLEVAPTNEKIDEGVEIRRSIYLSLTSAAHLIGLEDSFLKDLRCKYSVDINVNIGKMKLQIFGKKKNVVPAYWILEGLLEAWHKVDVE